MSGRSSRSSSRLVSARKEFKLAQEKKWTNVLLLALLDLLRETSGDFGEELLDVGGVESGGLDEVVEGVRLRKVLGDCDGDFAIGLGFITLVSCEEQGGRETKAKRKRSLNVPTKIRNTFWLQ